MEVIKFEVTRKDLRHKYSNPWDCPIYHALERVLPGCNIGVGDTTVIINGINFYLPPRYNKLAKERAQTFWGQIIGGFKGEIIRLKL